MMLNRVIPQADRPFLITPGTTTDYYGDTAESWDNPVRHRLPTGSKVQDRDSIEENGNTKRLATSEKVLYVPGRAVVSKDDRIEYRGLQYRVEGDPVDHRGPRGTVYATSVLKRTTGDDVSRFSELKLDHAGIREILSTGAVASIISGLGEQVAARVDGTLRSGDVMPVRVSHEVSDRARAVVVVAHPAAIAAEAKYGRLTSAAASAGLEVNGRGR